MIRTTLANQRWIGSTLIEMVLLLSMTGGLMLFTVRVLNLATEVHETGIRTATHLRLADSLEDRLRSDIARAHSVELASANELRLVMTDSDSVLYHLSQPNVVERKTLNRETSDGKSVANQRWQFASQYQMIVAQSPVGQGELVRIQLRRLPAERPWRMLREIEVIEVTRGQ